MSVKAGLCLAADNLSCVLWLWVLVGCSLVLRIEAIACCLLVFWKGNLKCQLLNN